MSRRGWFTVSLSLSPEFAAQVGALEADDLAFLLDSFEVDAPSGGLTGRGFRQYFAHALGEDFDEARDDLRKALGREA